MSTAPADIRRTFERIAEHPVPAPSPTFVADLERRLLEQATPRTERVAVLAPRPARRPRLVPVASIAAALVAAVVLFGALSGWLGSGTTETRQLSLAAAVDTTVQLPDGSSVPGRTGLALPDGAIVRTGPDGHASAGDVELGPGLVAVVDGGRLHLRSSSDAGTPETTPTTQPPAAGTTPASGTPAAPSSSAPSAPPGGVPQVPVTIPPVTVPPLPLLPQLPQLPL